MESFKLSKRALIGIAIILVGIAFLLDAFNLLDVNDFLGTFWPGILILIGLLSFLDRTGSKYFGITMIVMGTFFQLSELDLLPDNLNLWSVGWSIIIILVGLWFVIPKKKVKTFDSDSLSSAAIFSGANISNVSQNFKGGEVTAVFGGLEIDLTSSNLSKDVPVVIDAFAAFGGITLKVPQDWYVEIKGLPLLGGWDNKKGFPKNSIPPEKIVTIKCFIICGGIEIK